MFFFLLELSPWSLEVRSGPVLHTTAPLQVSSTLDLSTTPLPPFMSHRPWTWSPHHRPLQVLSTLPPPTRSPTVWTWRCRSVLPPETPGRAATTGLILLGNPAGCSPEFTQWWIHGSAWMEISQRLLLIMMSSGCERGSLCRSKTEWSVIVMKLMQ